MKAVIMAGGFGTRIQPLTINLPKPMIPLINRPIMLHIVELLKKHGIDELVLLLYHQPETIKNFFGDGSEFGVHISYVTPLEDFGTAGAVKAAAKYFDERFMVISGDLLTDFDLTAIINFHQLKQARATITLTPVSDPLQFGVVITDKQDRITKFLEKPGWGEVFSDTINTGIYILEPEVLELIPEGENRDWAKDVFPALLAADGALYGCTMTGYWADIGNTDAYLEASGDIAAGRVSVNIREPLAVPADRIHLGEEAQANLENLDGLVVVGGNTRIHAEARLKNSVLGRNCIVEEDVLIENAVLWDNVYVKQGSRISGAVLCHNVRVGQQVAIEAGVVIGDETTIGNGALLKRDVKVWPRKVIEAGATVTTNLIWGEKWRKSLFDGALVKGLTNIELTPEFTAKLGAAYGSTLPKDAFVLAGRDAFRSSRMLKRSFVGGLLSAGINVCDVKMLPLPVLRYKLTTYGELGGVHFRQSPDDPAATEIVFFDADGVEFSSDMAKNTERIFFKEDFRRAHYSEPGGISELPRIYDFYREGFLRSLDRDVLNRAKPKIVVDLNHSPAGDLLPSLLSELGCEVIELNSHVEESKTGTNPEKLQKTMDQLSRIVVTLEASAGFWVGPSGEKLVIIDETGVVLSDLEALSVLVALSCRTGAGDTLAVPVSAPQVVEDLAAEHGLTVQRTKNEGRALVEAAKNQKVGLAASMEGRFIFTALQPNFDALFSIAKTLELLTRTGQCLSQLRLTTRKRHYRSSEVACSFEFKGGIMRKMSEDSVDRNASFIDGVKVTFNDGWALVLPDQSRPVAHVVVEALDPARADALLESYQRKVGTWINELRNA